MTATSRAGNLVSNPQVNLWDRLFQPSPEVTSPEERQRARLLAAVTGALVPVSAVILLARAIADPASATAPDQIMGYIAVVFLSAMYAIARTRRYQIGAWLTAIFLSVTTIGALATSGSPVQGIFSLAVVILASMVLPLRSTIIVTAGTVIGVGATALLRPALFGDDYILLMGALLIISVMVIVAMQHRDQLEKLRREELERLNELLKASVEEARYATAMAREANRLKSEFLSTMSHELRTPLNAMIGFTEIMLAGMGGTLDADATHMVERVHGNSQRLLALINDVLDLARIEAQRLEVVNTPFSPQKMALNLRDQMASLVAKKGLSLDVRVDSELPLSITGDEGLIQKIVTNLLSNAIKFTERGGVTLALTRNDGSTWRIRVSDTGVGIPPHALTYIFDPFRQVDGTSGRAYGGSGLGLAIVQETARAMGGAVTVESKLGVGSTFTVTLPLTASSESVR